ncbi:BCCT, betaine/carnitine/choline family transporter domain-containing protein [Ditylenchus destructor]|nr:BCCT, betaine/carnitine/choline family transporter domain-containing protein [Ditylenchus destructor]
MLRGLALQHKNSLQGERLSMKYPLRPLVFWPTFLILLAAVIASYIDLNAFLAVMPARLPWCANRDRLLLRAGKVRIGGEDAQPLLSKWRWFMVALCTTLAVGVLFWTTAEPLYHLYGPPTSLPIEAGSSAAKTFAMSTMFLHWTLTPYAIYLVPSLVFALVFYNRRSNFSIGAMLEPLLGEARVKRYAGLIDTLAMFRPGGRHGLVPGYRRADLGRGPGSVHRR